MRLSLNMIVITELGGYAGQNSRRAKGRGNPPHRRTHGVCGCPGGSVSVKVSLPVNGGQCIQQYHQDSRLCQVSPGYPVRHEHHGSTVSSRELSQPESGPQPTARELGWGGLRVLALQPHVAGERASLLLQWVLHLKCFSSESSSHSRIISVCVGGHSGLSGYSLWCKIFDIESVKLYMGRQSSSEHGSWFKVVSLIFS